MNKIGGIEYDVVSGVSAGSINALTISLFEKGKEALMTDFMVNFSLSFNTSDFFIPWKPEMSTIENIAYAALFEPGLLNNTGMYNLIVNTYNAFPTPTSGRKLKRHIIVGAVDS
jgi:predicted acylesterase/phospholipase RssA